MTATARSAAARLGRGDWWIGRPIEMPGSRPLAFDPDDNMGLHLRDLAAPPRHQVPGVLSSRTTRIELRLAQERRVRELHEALRQTRSRAAARDHRGGRSAPSTTQTAARHGAPLLQPRHSPGLVEAAAADAAPPGARSPPSSRSAIRWCNGIAAARPRRAGGDAAPRRSQGGAGSRSAAASPSAAASSTRRRAHGSLARLDDAQATRRTSRSATRA